MKRLVTYVGAVAIFIQPCAMLWAKQPFYYHKPKVDQATFVTDLSECNALADGVQAPRYNVYAANLYAMAAGSFFAGFFGSREKRSMTENVLRTCMTDRGYRRVEAPDALLKDLNKLEEKERVDRLFALAVSEHPVGEVLPQ